MTFKILSCRSISLGTAMLLGFILLGSLALLPVAAQDKNVTCIGADLGSYAELGFCLAPQVVVEPESVDEANYTAGREVRASMLLNGSRASIHLLYPCQPPQTILEPAALKSLIEAYEPLLAQANYSNELLSVGGMPALGAMTADQIIVAYQPTNQTPAIVVMDTGVSDEILVDFLEYLRITIKEGTTPLMPGYRPDTTIAAAEANVENNAASSQVAEQTSAAETKPSAIQAAKDKMAEDKMSAKEKMKADAEAAKKKLAESMKRR